MHCNQPIVRNCILDSLRYWVSAYHVDGFRFDLASILSRDRYGNPVIYPPILDAIAHDPILGKSKLIAEAWDANGLYQVGSFPSWRRWSEWNGKYRDCVRKFLKGEADAAPELYRRIRGPDDLYNGRSTAPSINFVTCHDGFTYMTWSPTTKSTTKTTVKTTAMAQTGMTAGTAVRKEKRAIRK